MPETDKSVLKPRPRILSKINLQEGEFIIARGEIQELPENYKEMPLVMFCIKKGDLTILSGQGEKAEGDKKVASDETLDEKDVANFLNQNTRTVIKQLKINDLKKNDIDRLLIGERKGKNRKSILDFIKMLKKVE